MFAELILIPLAIFVLLFIDSFSTFFGFIVCVLIFYGYEYRFCTILNKRFIILVATKLLAIFSFCFRLRKQVYTIYERVFLSGNNFVSPPSHSTAEFCGNTACIENEINTLVLKISQYYIQSWYAKISGNDDFLLYLNFSIKHTLVCLCTSVSNVDKKKFSFNIMQVYLHFFSHFVEAKKKTEVFKKEHFKMKHWAMKDNMTEWCYLQSLVSTLLDSFCPSDCEKSLHSRYSPLLHTVVVEILTQNIIHPLVRVLSDPSRLNLMLLKLLINSMKTNGDAVNESFDNICPHQSSLASPEESNIYSNSPTILLPNDSDDSVFEVSNISETLHPVPLNCNMSEQKSFFGFSQGFPIKNCNKKSDFVSLASTGVKSSSNANLFEQEHSDPSSYNCLSDTTIKRSRSADYIRQMPLKALNERDYSMFIACKLEQNSCIEQAEEATEVEVPTLFTDVKITDTFQENEDGIPYTRYCIQYTGVFHDTGQSSDIPHYVQQVVSIKRRFKEFVALQSSLEDNPSLKIYLKAIKAPSKWLLPFSNLDKKHIAERKIFLENYLKQLCGYPSIAQSSELQEFLSYGRDSRLSFVKKNSETGVQRIDKILVRGVKGALDIIKTALPNSPIEDENVTLLPRSIIPRPSFEDISPIVKFQEHLLDYSSREPEIKEHIRNFMENNSASDAAFGDSYCYDALRNIQYFKTAECCNCPVLCESNFLQKEFPFGNTAMELVALCFELNDTNLGDPFSILKGLCAPCIDGFFVNKLDSISEEHLSSLLHILHKYLWPDERSSNDQTTSMENTVILNTIMEHLEVILSSKFGVLNINRALLEKINLFLSSIQHQEINRCLLYHMFDVIIEAVCP